MRLARAICAASMVGACCAWGGRALGAEDPVIVGERPAYQQFHLDPGTYSVEMVNRYAQSRVSNLDGVSTASEYVFQQQLNWLTRGYVLHPNFISLNLEFTAGSGQNYSDFDGESGWQYGAIYEWDVRAEGLRLTSTPFSLYSQRRQDWVARDFGPTLRTLDTRTGASVEFRIPRFPTRLEVAHLTNDQEAAGGVAGFSIDRDTFAWQTTAQFSPSSTLRWSYYFTHVEQGGQVAATSNTHDADLSHVYTFGEALRHSLESRLQARHQDGLGAYQDFRLEETLQLKHSDTFETRYQYNASYFDAGGTERVRHRGRASFRHRLFQSLVTTGSVGAEAISQPDGDWGGRYFGHVNFDYRKRVPWGALYINLGASLERETSPALGRSVQMVDRVGIFDDPQPLLISGPRIDPASVVVTDASGLQVFAPGADYTIRSFGNRVELSRVVGGAIANQQSVLVDYVLGPTPAVVIDSQGISANVRYAVEEGWLAGLGVFAGYAFRGQALQSDDPDAFPREDSTDYTFGVDYFRSGLALSAMHQIHESGINPFRATRLSAGYSSPLGMGFAVSTRASYSMFDYTDDDRSVDLLMLSASLQYSVSPELRVLGTVLWRDETDSGGGDVRGFEQQLEVRWQRRQTSAYLKVRNATLDTADVDTSFQTVELGLRREF